MTAAAVVSAAQRYTRARRCPICAGAESDPRGQEKRCIGFLSADGEYARCSRDEHAGALTIEHATQTYAHRLVGDCRCGMRHGGEAERPERADSRIVATYDYTDEAGKLLFQVVREVPKRFLQRRPDGRDGWIWSLGDVRRVLYRLPELVAANPEATVYVVEGEKDADNLAALGLVATTNAGGVGGVGQWRDPTFCQALRDRHVIVIPDADAPGGKHAAAVARALVRIAATVRVMELPGPEKDATDWLSAGGTAEKLLELAQSAPLDAAVAAPNPHRKTMVERALALRMLKMPRIETPLSTLNAATRGLAPGVVIIAGPPGAGKTATAMTLGMFSAANGVPVYVLSADESADRLLIRVGQAEGFERASLEDGDGAAVAAFADRLSEFSEMEIVDTDEEPVTVELAIEELQKRAAGRPAILVIDSLQTVRADGTDTADGPRARLDVVVRVLKVAARCGIVVIVTSEVARAAYRARNPSDRIDPLAAVKESGSAEYAADLLLVLIPVADSVGLVDVVFAKNRWGSKPPMRLRLDFDRGTVSEVSADAASPATASDEKAGDLERDMERVREALRGSPGIAGYDRLRGALARMSMARRRAAVTALRDAGEIVDRGTRQQPRLYLALDSTLPGLPGSTTPTVDPRRPSPTALPEPYRGRAEGRPDPVGQPDELTRVGPESDPEPGDEKPAEEVA